MHAYTFHKPPMWESSLVYLDPDPEADVWLSNTAKNHQAIRLVEKLL